MSARMLTDEEMVNAVKEGFSKHYNIPDLESRITVQNYTNPNDPDNILGYLCFHLVGRHSRTYTQGKVEAYRSYHERRHITPDNVDTFVSKLVSAVQEAVHGALEGVCTRAHPKKSSSHLDRLFCSEEGWRDALLTNPFLTAFYNVDVQYNNRKTHAVVTFTDKDPSSGRKCEAYLHFTKTGVRISKPDNFEFVAIKEGRGKSIQILITDSAADLTTLDKANVKLHVPRKGYAAEEKVLSYWEIKEQTSDFVHIDMYRVDVGPEDSISKTRSSQVVKLHPSGKPYIEYTSLDIEGTWLDNVRCWQDVIKNPVNTAIHQHLDPADVPLYEGQHLFVTSQKEVYVQIIADCWIPVNSGMNWATEYAHILPQEVSAELGRYLLAQKLMT